MTQDTITKITFKAAWGEFFQEVLEGLRDLKSLLMGLLTATGSAGLFGISFTFPPLKTLIELFGDWSHYLVNLIPYLDVPRLEAQLISIFILCAGLFIRGIILKHPSIHQLKMYKDLNTQGFTGILKGLFMPNTLLLGVVGITLMELITSKLATSSNEKPWIIGTLSILPGILLLWHPRTLFSVCWAFAFLLFGDWAASHLQTLGAHKT